LYNYLLEQRKNTWEQEQKSISYSKQSCEITKLKDKRPNLKQVYSQVLLNVARRLDNAFQNFFRRVKRNQNPGYPRFKGKNRFHSITYPQFGFAIKDCRLELAKIGSLKIKMHRPIKGNIKTCTITRKPTGKWYASFVVEYEPQPLPESKEVVGIDVGIKKFATLSTGEQISNPHFFKKEEKVLAKAQRKLAKITKEKGRDTPEYRKAKKVVSRIHERIYFKRHDFIHQIARQIVDRFGVICVEDLRIKNMMRNNHLAKSIGEVAWGNFIQELGIKAEEAGRKFIRVKPNNTSQMCSRCHHIVPKDLSVRVHVCPHCGLVLDRDLNAAYNILALGLQSLGNQSLEAHVF